MVVYIDKVKKYSITDLESSIENAFKKLHIDFHGRKVVLKPNIVIPAKPNSGIITHPLIVEATINVLRKFGFNEFIIAESSGIGVDTNESFRVSKYKELIKRGGVKLIDFNKTDYVKTKWKYGLVNIPKIILEADLYINLPKMKTHSQTTVSLSIKNQKGLLSSDEKKLFHSQGIYKPLIEYSKLVKPDLIIVDGIVGMEGEGPIRGKKKKANALVIGTNLLETDITCCKIMKIDPLKVKHIIYAIKQKIGPKNPIVLGVNIEKFNNEFKKANERYGKILNVYSWRNPYACSMCIDSFISTVRESIFKPSYWLFLSKFIYYALFKRIDIIQGKYAKLSKKYGKIICLGKCTEDLAKKYNYLWIKGCPPKTKDIIKAIK